MNVGIHSAFVNAVLADACYVDGLRRGMTPAELTDKLKSRLTNSLAQYVGNDFRVVTQHTDPGSSGFSATVFADSSGQTYISLRGTQPNDPRDWITDADAYIGSGLAQRQIIAMVNWYERAIATDGSSVTQLVEVTDPESGVTDLETTVVTATEDGALSGSASVQVNGHSLGGHLTTIFTRLFSGIVSTASTYNGLGVGRIFSESLLTQIGSLLGFGSTAWQDGKQTNYYAEHGINAATTDWWLNQRGDRIALFNEEQTGIDNHLMYKLTDSLALADVMGDIDSGLTLTSVGTILNAASPRAASSLETTLDAFRKLANTTDQTSAKIGDAEGTAPSRVDFHDKLAQLRDSIQNNNGLRGAIISLTDKSAADFMAGAQNDIAYRYALKELNPFAVMGGDSLYAPIIRHGELDLLDPSTGKGLSDSWLQARSAMLSWKMLLNIQKFQSSESKPYNGGLGTPAVYFEDQGSGTRIYLGQPDWGQANRRHYVFGTTDGQLVGGNLDDSLFAGDGNETLSGGTGNDYLEAGRGQDALNGGKGNDTYQLDALLAVSNKTDTVDDTDGVGSIWLGQKQLTGGKTVSANFTWTGDDGIQYRFQTTRAGGLFFSHEMGTLTISQGALAANNDQIVINDFDLNAAQSKDGYLGIRLGNEQISVVSGVSRNLDQFATGDFSNTVATAGTAIAQGAEQMITVFVSAVRDVAQHVKVGLANAAQYFGINTGAELLPLANGPVTLTIPAGADSVSFALCNIQDAPTDGTLQLTATLVDPDAPGESAPASDTLAVDYKAKISAPTDFHDLTGSPIYDDNHSVIGYSYSGDGGNDRVVAGSLPIGANLSYSTDNNVTGSTVNDTIVAGQGNVVIEGNGGQDIIYGGLGRDSIFAGSAVDLTTAIAAAKTASASGQKGAFIGIPGAAGAASDLIVGGNGNDFISIANGNAVVVLGPGNDTVLGGVLTGGVLANWNMQIVDGQFRFQGINYLQSADVHVDFATGAYVYAGPYTAGPAFEGNVVAGDGYGTPVSNGDETIFGGSGNDYIITSNGNNYVDAGSGNSTVQGGAGNDTLFGGTGDCLILGQGGDDYLDAESGNSTLVGGSGNNIIFGGTGNDVMFAGDNHAGTWASQETGNNYVEGGSGNDLIYGSAGNDTLIGGGGNDTIRAGNGNEYIETGDGNSVVFGGSGTNVIVSGDGNDTLVAGSGNTTIYGGEGTDVITGGSGINVLYAGDGGTLAAPTQITAGSGDTTIYGGAGINVIKGGAGNTVIYVGDGGTADNPAQVTAGAGATTIYGGGGDAVLDGTAASSDYLQGGGADDTLLGGAGDDTLVAGSGTDYLVGGSGKNIYVVGDSGGDAEIKSISGDDILRFDDGISVNDVSVSADFGRDGKPALVIDYERGSVIIDGGLNGAINQFVFADGTYSLDALMSTAYTSEVQMAGATGNLQFDTGGNASLTGGVGNDAIYGWGGNDTLTAGAGATTLVGGGGNDTFVVNSAADVVIERSSAGTNTIVSSVSYVLPDNVQDLVLTGTDDLTGTGNDLANLIIANSGNDTLVAGSGNATLVGGQGNDVFVVNANSGNTEIAPGSCSNILRFGAGVEPNNLSLKIGADRNGAPALIVDDGLSETIIEGGLHGSIPTFEFANGGMSTFSQDSEGTLKYTAYNAQGAVIGDQYINADGTYGTHVFNSDGSSTGTEHYVDGTSSRYVNNGLGAVETIHYDAEGRQTSDTWNFPDGAYSVVTNDGAGRITTTVFGSSGAKLSDTWTKSDGTFGTDVYYSDGSSAGTSHNADGSYSRYTNDAYGGVKTSMYTWNGALTGSVVAQTNGNQNAITSFLNSYGNKIAETWLHADGQSGSDLVSGTDYNGAANVAYMLANSIAPGTNGYVNPYSSNTCYYYADYSGYYQVSMQAPTAGTLYQGWYWVSPYGGMTNAKERLNAPIGQIQLFNYQTSYQLLDPLSGVTFNGTRNADGTKSVTIYVNGVYSTSHIAGLRDPMALSVDAFYGCTDTLRDDGLGNVELIRTSAQGVQSDAWLHNDGSFGGDAFFSNGSSAGAAYYASGLETVYYNDGQGHVTQKEYGGLPRGIATSYYATRSIVVHPGSNEMVLPNSGQMGFPVVSASDGNGGVVEVYFSWNGTATVVDRNAQGAVATNQVATDPGYMTSVKTGSQTIQCGYGASGVLSSRSVDEGLGIVTTDLYDVSGNVSGRKISTKDAQGNITAQDYDTAGNLIGYSLTTTSPNFARTDSYSATGALFGYSITTSDGKGDSLTDNYDASNNLLSYSTTQVTGYRQVTTTNYDATGTAINVFVVSSAYQGQIATSSYDGTGKLIDSTVAMVDSSTGKTTTGTYDANGKLTAYIVSGLTSQGGPTLSVYDGHGVTRLSNSQDLSGNLVTVAQQSNGDTITTTRALDGSYSIATNDGKGFAITENFNAKDVKLGDSWTRLDGSSGSDTLNTDGTSNGRSVFADGSSSTYINNGDGQITSTHFAADGVTITGTTVTAVSAEKTITTNYDSDGIGTSDTWIESSGISGSDTISSDGTRQSIVYDGRGNSTTINYDPQGSIIDGTWTHSDGTSGPLVFDYRATGPNQSVTGAASGADTIVGGYSNDTLVGGSGPNTFVVGDSTVVIEDPLNSGSDIVKSSVSYTLPESINQLILTGPSDLMGTGNSLADVITGNSGNNTLIGGGGNDTLYGGDGGDVLIGGLGDDILRGEGGNDRYVFEIGDGADRIIDGSGSDTLFVAGGLTEANLEAERVGNDMLIHVLGSTDFITLTDWFAQSEGVDRIEFSDGSSLDRMGIDGLQNRPPIAHADNFSISEDDGALTVSVTDLLANDTDPNAGDVLSVVSVGQPQVGATVTLANGSIAYDIGNAFQQLAAGEVVKDSFTYTITDTKGATSSSLVNVDIVGVNDAPVVTADSATIVEGTLSPLGGNVLSNDHDVDHGTVLGISAPGDYNGSYGTLSLGADGQFTYSLANGRANVESLAQGEIAVDHFVYGVTDGIATLESAIDIQVTGINDAPTALPDEARLVEDGTLIATGNVLANDFDPDHGTALQVANAGTWKSALGTLTLDATGAYVYTLDNASNAVQSLGDGESVVERFTYQATDGAATTAGELAITIDGKNDGPVPVNPLHDRTLYRNFDFSWQIPADSFTDIDHGDTLTYSAKLSNGSELPAWLKFDAATRTFSGKVPANAKGSMEIQVSAADGHGGQSVATNTFKVELEAGNGPWDQHGPNGNGGECGNHGSPHGHGGYENNDGHDHGEHQEEPPKQRMDDAWDFRKGEHLVTVDPKKLDQHFAEFDGGERKFGDSSYMAHWIDNDLAVSRWIAEQDKSLPEVNERHGADIGSLNDALDFLGSKQGYGVDAVSLMAGAGTQLKSFKGLQEGMQKIG